MTRMSLQFSNMSKSQIVLFYIELMYMFKQLIVFYGVHFPKHRHFVSHQFPVFIFRCYYCVKWTFLYSSDVANKAF